MKPLARVLAVVGVGATLAVLSGCSTDTVLWGPDGARVIDATEQLIDAASTAEQDSLACQDSVANFGEPGPWDGLAAGEPERSETDTSVDRPGLDAAWRINLEGSGSGAATGDEVPTDVFYREIGDDLCVADIIWQKVND